MSSSSIDEIEIRQITQQDSPQVIELLHKYFFVGEPLNTYTEPKSHIEQEEEDYIMNFIPHNTSFIAIHKPTQKAVGVCMAGPQYPDDVDHLLEEAAKHKGKKWGKIMELMAFIEQNARVTKRYNVSKIMYIIATCVDTESRGKRIGARLYHAVQDRAKELGYELLRADCSSHYSAQIKEQLGWDCIHTVFYKDYVDDSNVPIFTPHPPHVCCKSYAIRL